jgi:uncharacterized integral membrane protein
LLKSLAGFLVILGLVVFALSNRVLVPLGFWPFGVVQVWLGLAMAGALGAGFVLGLLALLPKHFSLHSRARNAEKRLAQLTSAQDAGKTGP